MVNEIKYTNIKRVLDNLLDHPMLRNVSLEQAIRYTIRFISLHGYPALYQDKVTTVDIDDYRGALPCDLIRVIQVKNVDTNRCLISMTDTFNPALEEEPKETMGEESFKIQGRVIYTSFKKGKVEISYKAIPVDDEGYPLLIDNETYLACLEAYIKKQVFTVLYDLGKIQLGVMNNAQTDYAFLAAELKNEMLTPSLSEMQSITNIMNTLLVSDNHFYNSFRNLGDKEYIRKH